jgi:hypothetical protein
MFKVLGVLLGGALLLASCGITPTDPNGGGFYYSLPSSWRNWNEAELPSSITANYDWVSVSGGPQFNLNHLLTPSIEPWSIAIVMSLTNKERGELSFANLVDTAINFTNATLLNQPTELQSGVWRGEETEWSLDNMTIWEVSWVNAATTTVGDLLTGCSSICENSYNFVIENLNATFVPDNPQDQ